MSSCFRLRLMLNVRPANYAKRPTEREATHHRARWNISGTESIIWKLWTINTGAHTGSKVRPSMELIKHAEQTTIDSRQ